jgi:hypothetical protein
LTVSALATRRKEVKMLTDGRCQVEHLIVNAKHPLYT